MTVRLAPNEFKFIVLHCDAGQVATGGGYGSDGPVLFSENSPVGTTGWVVGGRNTTTAAQLQAVGYVVCAPTVSP